MKIIVIGGIGLIGKKIVTNLRPGVYPFTKLGRPDASVLPALT